MTAVEFQDFSFQYDAQAEPTLRDIHLTIREGEKVLIAGRSGSGKSTLAHCINGLIPFSHSGTLSGSLRVFGRETKEMSLFELSKKVGTVLQDADGQFIGLTVGEDIAFALENDAVPRGAMREKVRATALSVGVEKHLAHAPHEMSGGQKQRVSLAGVLVDDVKLLLFDEPLANLDPAAGRQAIEMIDEVHKRLGVTVVIVEHRIEDVLHRPVDRIVLMDEGRIVADGAPDEMLACSLLRDLGIREPLYVTALGYAGVPVTPGMRPRAIGTLVLSEDQKAAVRRWFEGAPPAPEKALGEALLEVQTVDFSYANGCEALKDVNLTVRRGEMMSIVGRNGAGKSTLAKLICGFENPTKGALRLHGENLAGQSVRKRAMHIGYVMQNPNQMISHPLIYDEVASGLTVRGESSDAVRAKVEETLQICGLYPFRKWPVSALSYGQKKRVTIASILAMGPEIIILDEPTAGQDFRHYTEIMEFLRSLNARGVTVVMITHDMHLMLEYCDRAAVFSQGRLIADQRASDVLTDPGVVSRASLKETSLQTLAELCGIGETAAFVQCFIDWDRRVRGA